MRLTIEPTADFATVNGARCRAWTGADGNGTEVLVWVAMVSPQTHDEQRLASFDAELRALPTPSIAMSIDMRFLVD